MKALLILALALATATALDVRRVSRSNAASLQAADVCASGKQQSPVNIIWNNTVCVRQGEAGAVPFGVSHHFKPAANATVKNDGNTLTVTGDFGFLTVGGCNPCDGQEYTVQNIAFKAPAEHQLDGRTYAAEIQITTQKKGASDILVESVFLYQQPDGGFLNSFLEAIDLFHSPASGATNTISKNTVDLKTLKEAYRSEFYTYKGSLTASPCTEGATWVVYKTPVGATKEQIATLTSTVNKASSRAAQDLNGRQVTWYRKRQ